MENIALQKDENEEWYNSNTTDCLTCHMLWFARIYVTKYSLHEIRKKG